MSQLFPIKSKKFLYSVISILALLLITVGCGTQTSTSSNKEPYKIGLIASLTGPSSSLGNAERNGVKMLVDQINAKGGVNGHQLALNIYDDQSNQGNAVLAAKKAIEDDQDLAVIGGSTSPIAMAINGTFEKAQVPLIALGSASAIDAGKKWVFKTNPDDLPNAKSVADYVAKQGWKKIAYLAPNNAYGDSEGKGLQEAIKGTDMQIIAEVRYSDSDKDMTVELTKLKEANPDVIVNYATLPAGAIVIKNWDQLGLRGKIPYVGGSGLPGIQLLDLAGTATEGTMYSSERVVVADQLPDSDPVKSVVQEYAANYTKLYGPIQSGGSNGYDAVQLLQKALGEAGADRAKIRDALENIKGLKGMYGIYNMSPTDHTGLAESAFVIIKVENGKYKLLHEYETK